jgi:hypothetical protein
MTMNKAVDVITCLQVVVSMCYPVELLAVVLTDMMTVWIVYFRTCHLADW